MTKQEEIKEEMARRLHTEERALLRIVNEISPNNCMWEELAEFQKDYYRKSANRYLSYLHSQGVMVKVDMELPENPYICEHKWPCSACGVSEGQAMMVGAGYIAVEPLIK